MTRVITGGDRETCGLLQLLSPALCLVLLGTSLEWTVNDTPVCRQFFLSARASTTEFPATIQSHAVTRGREPSKRLFGSSDRLYWRRTLFEVWGFYFVLRMFKFMTRGFTLKKRPFQCDFVMLIGTGTFGTACHVRSDTQERRGRRRGSSDPPSRVAWI